ncbi:MAG: RNA polymerase sigma factor [Olsenella sp.]|nr:RNA polymerase sigma factor [Olsenella sp.]MCH3956193.1 RNA polymerase sigma factor [Olsenella sp.]MCI1666655.1 RNA polymerase sigma factor [Olsenella sp.]MCI2123872.1 RNA polymerase sigma factor [Olsenella sp.]MCI2126974.1 RNA polymerase sigma factor [Olsenella sp.]
MRDSEHHAPCSGRESFIRRAMDLHGDAVYLVALSQTRSQIDAQDVSQDVFLRLLTSKTEFADEEHLRAWLLRVTINRCHELYRSPWHKRIAPSDEMIAAIPSTDLDPAEAAVSALEQNPVWAALKALPEKLRVVALLHYVEEYPTETIAAIVGCPPATVRTRLHRARLQMKRYLESMGMEGNNE